MSASGFESGLSCAHAGIAGDGPAHALPGDPRNWPRDKAASLDHLKLEVAVDHPNGSVGGTATYTLTPFNDGVSEVQLDAVDMSIGRVTVDGKRAKERYDGEKLTVPVGKRRKRGEPIEVTVEYTATPRAGLHFIGPDEGYPEKPEQVWTQGQDTFSKHWFPCIDSPNSKQTTELIVTVPGAWFALSNGDLEGDVENDDGTRTFHWSQKRPHATYLVTLAAGEFERIEASSDGLTIDFYVEKQDVARAKRTFKSTPAMVKLFERVSGMEFPWAKYSQIVVRDFIFGGMENTSATTMTENILLDAKAARDLDSDGLVAHELAHMWWGDLLTCRDWGHGWLNEGFASYAELLWREEHKGADEYRQGVLDETAAYVGEGYRRPVVTNTWREPLDIFDRHLYEKGALILHTLRGVLGDDQFFRSVQRYVRENADTNVVTQNLVDAIEAETGRNMEWFFDQYVYRPGHPKLTVSWSWDDTAKLATVKVKQTQNDKDGTKVFRVPVTIDFLAGEGKPKPVAFPVEVAEREQAFVFPLEEKPDLCRFDPYDRVLKELNFERGVPELVYQLANDDDIVGRRSAAAELGEKGGTKAVEALGTALANDNFWGVQAAAARALGAIKTEAARDVLLANIGLKAHKPRRAVVAALGEFREDATVLEALRPVAKKDQSYFVEAEANRSMGKLRLAEAFEELVVNSERASHREVVRAASIDGIVALRDERGFEVISRSAVYGAPGATRAGAVGALARLGEHFPDRKVPLGEEIAGYLDDPEFRVRIAAMNALKQLGDRRWIRRLDAQASREIDGRGLRTSRQAVAALRKDASTPEDVKALRDELDELRQENLKLRERMEKVEATNGDS